MGKQNVQIRNFITPGDIFAVLVIASGLVVAMVFEEIAIRMIGVSISILGAVALFMLISQRLSDVVESRYPRTGTPAPEFTMTTTKDSAAKRQTVEDFKQSFGGEDDFPIAAPSISKPEAADTIAKSVPPVSAGRTSPVPEGEHGYNDGFSGMRIVGKVKPVYKEQSVDAANPVISKEIPKEPAPADKQSLNQNITESTRPVITEPVNRYESYRPAPQPAAVPLIEEVPNIKEDFEEDIIQSIPGINKVKSETIQSDEIASKSKYSGKVIDLPLNVFMETDQLLGDEPRKEFEYFMTRVLMIIRSSTDTRTALFMLFNAQSEELILESYVTSVPAALKTKLRFNLAGDIISQIISNAKPQILTEINPAAELDLIPYYNISASTGSLIGVPVFWGEGVVGVLVADSESKNAYDSGTVAFLGHFTKLIGALVRSYTHKYDLLQASKTLESINSFYQIAANSRNGSENISEVIADSIKTIFPNAITGLCGFDGQSDSWRIKSYRGSGKDCTGIEVSIDDTLLGTSIYECRTIHLKSSALGEMVRVHKDELTISGEFVSVPVKSTSQIYGAIYLETDSKDSFTEFDISVIELIGEHAGNNIEKLFLLESLQNSAVVDRFTGLLNPAAFYKRIQEELARSKDLKSEMALCFFRFDKYASLDPNNYPSRFEHTSQLILERIKRYLKEYDVYGSVDDSTYGILFLGRDSSKSRMNAERIRADVANTIIEHGGGRFSVTISMGMISPTGEFDIDVLIKDALTGLEIASETGNQVQVLY